MRIHGIRDKTFPSPVPQLKKNYKNGTLTKNRSRDEELAFAQTTSSLKSHPIGNSFVILCCNYHDQFDKQ